LRDVFHRWDGFRFYASFSEFVPSVALVMIFWTILAAIISVFAWLPVRIFENFSIRRDWKIRIEHVLVSVCVFILLGEAVWLLQTLKIPFVPSVIKWNLKGLTGLALVGILITCLFRKRAGQWVSAIHESITPLVWAFLSFAILSVPLVTYHAWIKQTDHGVSQAHIQTSGAGEDRPNILLVTFDALTARDMSVYGYHKPTTPFMTQWAKDASVFTKAEAESNFTAPTTASLMTGKRVWTHQTYHIWGTRPDKSDVESLPLLLKKNGYFNMAFVANAFASVTTLGVSNSFEIAPPMPKFVNPSWSAPFSVWYDGGIIDVSLFRLIGEKIRRYNWILRILKQNIFVGKLLKQNNIYETALPPDKVFNRFFNVLDNNTSKPFFAWIHLHPPHKPYLPPEPYLSIYDSSSELRTLRSQRDANRNEKNDIFRARYDGFIQYCDKKFEDFIARLHARGILKNTIIIVSADHGESFEHNYLGHADRHLYEQVTHIPLIIKEPGQTDGKLIDNLVEQIDIPATILDLARIPVPSWMEGRSLVPLLQGKELPLQTAFSMTFHKNPSRGHEIIKGTIAVWEGDYKLIHYLEKVKSLLFNLRDDPDELDNLFNRKPEIGQKLLSVIQYNLRKANERISQGK
jgi:arylsulfatase A-like enzyme